MTPSLGHASLSLIHYRLKKGLREREMGAPELIEISPAKLGSMQEPRKTHVFSELTSILHQIPLYLNVMLAILTPSQCMGGNLERVLSAGASSGSASDLCLRQGSFFLLFSPFVLHSPTHLPRVSTKECFSIHFQLLIDAFPIFFLLSKLEIVVLGCSDENFNP